MQLDALSWYMALLEQHGCSSDHEEKAKQKRNMHEVDLKLPPR